MMKYINLLFLIILFLVLYSFKAPLYSQEIKLLKQDNSIKEKYKTWIAEEPNVQLREEGHDDQMGYGRFFVPTFTFSEWEPKIKVYNRKTNEIIDGLRTGASNYLRPGSYRVLFGSATETYDMVQSFFEIKEQDTEIIEPNWSCLLVNVIDEYRQEVRYGYEIYHYDVDLSVGQKYSRGESDYDDSKSTWILKPGKYKLVKLGEPFNTFRNFTTFELLPGELKQYTLVVGSDDNNFIGAGELIQGMYTKKTFLEWTEHLFVKGNITFDSYNTNDNEENVTNISFKGKIENQFKYDHKPYYANLKQEIETEFRKDGDNEFRISYDKLKLQNIGIYFFTDIFGVYTQVTSENKIFPGTSYHNSNTNAIKIDSEGNQTTFDDILEVSLSPMIFPINVSEEIGLNFSLLETAYSNFYIRTGIGTYQTINDNVYIKSIDESNDTLSVFREQDNEFYYGYVFSSGANFQLSNNLTYTAEANYLYAIKENEEDYQFTWDNYVNYRLLKYISIDYNLALNFNKGAKHVTYNNRLALEFSYYLDI